MLPGTEVTSRRGRLLRGGGCGGGGAGGKMPVAVMAENSFSFRKLLEQCETQELEVRRGRARGWRGPGGGLVCSGGAGAARSARGFGAGVSSRGGWVRGCCLKVLLSES